MNETDLEKAGGQLDEASAAPFKLRSGTSPRGEAGGRKATTDPENSDEPRRNAKMWALYLEEAEKEAKELAEVLKNGLESLLVFAGLFAGVVASFVIDSRRDLQPDPQQVLLADIRNALRNETASQDMFKPSTSSLWINGLWFTSLMITLFSAVLGVLAKTWLVKYTPVVGGKESEDAYRRYIRDDKARHWHLEQIITAAPLLIQIALFLFALGFGLQSVGDHPTLGWGVLASVFIAIFLYVIATLLPLFIPWCPLQTPLSHALSDAIFSISELYRSILHPNSTLATPKGGTRIHLSWRDGSDKNEVLSNIWYRKLILSTKPSNVDEALAELTQVKLDDTWWYRFVDCDVPAILCQRLRESTSGTRRESRYEVLCDHLRSLLGFVDYLERSAPHRLSEILKKFLTVGNALHRWNIFPEEIRALAFSARTPIMIACNEDYTTSEMEERPWEMMVRDMPPDHRRNFAMAACRGLVGGRDGLRKVGALSIVISIAKATMAANGTKSEWGVGIDKEARDEVERLGQKYLEKLFEEIANGWKALLLETFSKPSSTSTNSDFWDIMILSGLGSELKHRDSKVRTHAIKTLKTFTNDADFGDAVKSSIPKLADIIVNDPDEEVRANGTKALMKLVQNKKFQGFAKRVLPKSLSSALNASTLSHRARAINDIAILIKRPEFQIIFQNDVGPLISNLINRTIHARQEVVFAAGKRSLLRLAQSEGIRDQVKVVLLGKLREAFRYNPPASRYSSVGENRVDFVNRLVMVLLSCGFQDSTNPDMSQLVEMTTTQKIQERRIIRMKVLVLLAQGNDFSWSTILPELRNVLNIEPDQRSCASWIDIFLKVSDRIEVQNSIESAIPTLLKITMGGTDADTHTAGLMTLTSLTESLRDSIRPLLPGVLKSALKHPDQEARTCTLKTLTRLTNKLNIEDTNKAIIQALIYVVINDDNDNVRAAAVESLSALPQAVSLVSPLLQENLELAFKGVDWQNGVRAIATLGKNPQFRDIIPLALPNLVEMAAFDKDADVQTAGVRLVAYLVQHDIFGDIIRPIVSRTVLDLVPKTLHWQGRIAWFETLVMLAKDSNFRSSVESALPEFLDIVTNDENRDARAAGLKSLASITRDDSFRRIIEPRFTEILHSAAHDSSHEFRIARAEVLVILARIPNYQDYIESEISNLADMIARDGNKDVRVAIVRTLVTLARDGPDATRPTTQGAIKSALPKCLDLAWKDPNWEVRIAWVDALVELAHSADFRDNLHSAIPKLINVITSDEDMDARIAGMKALTSLTQDSKLDKKSQDTIVSALPKSFGSVFDDSVLRADWARVLDILIRRDVRIGGIVESAIPQIVDIAIQDDVINVRDSMIKLLALLAKDDTNLHNTISLVLSKNLDSVLKAPYHRHLICAIETLSRLAPDSNFHGVLKSVMPQLLKVAVNDGERGVREIAVELLNTIRTDSNETKEENTTSVGDAIILSVPSAVILLTPEGHDIRQVIDSLLHFAVAPANPELTAKLMENVLKPMLKGSGWLTRAAAVEFLGVLKIYSLITSFRKFIQSAIPDIIILTLEDKEDDVCTAGIRSLVNLAEEGPFRNKIKAALPQLMQLVEVSHLRGPVTELISLLAVDDIVRKDIVSRIVNPLVSLKTGVYPDGLLELLSRLVIDKRFSRQQASDEVVLSVASVLLMQPGAVSFRLKTVTALWCNYGVSYASRPHEKFSNDLIDLFLFTLFGRHVTENEANKWCSMAFHLPSIAESNRELTVSTVDTVKYW